ncbi:MAG TPA: molybdopterin cofactor-binding domain-containing protein, partial [Phycisphaerae bacterium]
GAPQTLFAIERHMDFIADRLGIDPAELRRRNLLRDGQTMATGQVFRDGTDLVRLLVRALDLAGYEQRRAAHRATNASHPYLRRGIGMCTYMHGAGFTGSGETLLASEVWVEGLSDGRVEVLTANTDMGQGTETVLLQIAADALRIPTENVSIAVPDTSRVPNSGPTVASRTAMVVGKLIERACHDLLAQVEGSGFRVQASGEANSSLIRAWHAAHLGQRLIGKARYVKPQSIEWDDQNYRGDAYACYSWAAHVAEVEVDLRTYGVRVTDYVALQEVGKVVNPTLARGQVAGGVVQGIGWALMEDVVVEDGAMKNNQMTNYIIPVSADVPPIRVYFEENPSPFGPQGAKGIGELPIDGPAPAVINAVCDALGVPVSSIPATPERLLRVLSPES